MLAGSAIALALDAVTVMLLLLFREETVGLFAWGSGSLVQNGLATGWPRWRRWCSSASSG